MPTRSTSRLKRRWPHRRSPARPARPAGAGLLDARAPLRLAGADAGRRPAVQSRPRRRLGPPQPRRQRPVPRVGDPRARASSSPIYVRCRRDARRAVARRTTTSTSPCVRRGCCCISRRRAHRGLQRRHRQPDRRPGGRRPAQVGIGMLRNACCAVYALLLRLPASTGTRRRRRGGALLRAAASPTRSSSDREEARPAPRPGRRGLLLADRNWGAVRSTADTHDAGVLEHRPPRRRERGDRGRPDRAGEHRGRRGSYVGAVGGLLTSSRRAALALAGCRSSACRRASARPRASSRRCPARRRCRAPTASSTSTASRLARRLDRGARPAHDRDRASRRPRGADPGGVHPLRLPARPPRKPHETASRRPREPCSHRGGVRAFGGLLLAWSKRSRCLSREAIVERTGSTPRASTTWSSRSATPTARRPASAAGSALQAGLPIGSPGMQLDRRCGGGLQAVATAAMMVQTGAADVVMAGGVESMSNVEYYTTDMRWGARAGLGHAARPARARPRALAARGALRRHHAA